MLQLVTIAFQPNTVHLQEEHGFIFSIASRWVIEGSNEITLTFSLKIPLASSFKNKTSFPNLSLVCYVLQAVTVLVAPHQTHSSVPMPFLYWGSQTRHST